MKKIIKLTEDDLSRIIQRVIRESDEPSDTEDSSLFDDDISKVKKCFADVKKLGPLNRSIEFPTSCNKDLNSTCIEDLKIEISEFMGATQKKDGSLIGCLKKVGKLKDPLSKWEQTIA